MQFELKLFTFSWIAVCVNFVPNRLNAFEETPKA